MTPTSRHSAKASRRLAPAPLRQEHGDSSRPRGRGSLPPAEAMDGQPSGPAAPGASPPPRDDSRTFRTLVESMNEGAVTTTADGTITYANPCFARMIKWPLEEAVTGSVLRFFAPEDQRILAPLLRRKSRADSKCLVSLEALDGSRLTTHVWIRPIMTEPHRGRIVGMIITNMTDAEPGETVLRSLTHRVVQAHEAERGQVALELHEQITQVLCAILFRCQRLAGQLPPHQRVAHAEAMRIARMLGETAEEVERISRNLRPSVLDNLGLIAALGATHAEFVARTGIALKVSVTPLTVPLSAEADIALYRIHQEALNNVEQHARAQHVAVELTQHHEFVKLAIKDDGLGFVPDLDTRSTRKHRGAGIFSMRERAAAVGGTLKVESRRDAGTLVEAQIPFGNQITRSDHE